jgi:hypothetical protein
MTAAAVTAAGRAMVAALYSGHVFGASVMGGRAYMALPIPRFVPLEVVERPRATIGQRASVTTSWIIAVVDVTVEAVRPMEPGAGSDEQTSNEPIRPIVAVGSTVIGCEIEVPVRAHRCNPNVDRDLARCDRSSAEQRSRYSGKSERFEVAHTFSWSFG